MKVLFLRNVPKVGKKFEIKDVADGFAHNNLIPRKLAVPATPAHIQQAAMQQASSKEKEEESISLLKDIEKRSATTPLVLPASANTQGHLFKGIHRADIVEAVRAFFGLVLLERDIVLPSALKEIGVHTVTVDSGAFRSLITIHIVEKK